MTSNRSSGANRRQTNARRSATNDVEELRALTAETLAIKMMLSQVLVRICALDPVLAAAIHSGIQDAATKLKASSVKSDNSSPYDPTIEALGIVDALRAALIINQAALL
jgi:hypothetical protein